MRKMKKVLALLLSVVAVLMSMSTVAMAADVELGTTGGFNMITYNVSGLPVPASMDGGTDAFDNQFLIGQQLNAMGCDIIAVQEDFNYDSYLRSELKAYANESLDGTVVARHATEHSGGVPLGDGMNIFSKYAIYNVERVPWNVTAGAIPQGDELTPKGFMVTTIELEKGYFLDVYDLHADAYGSPVDDQESIDARRSQFTQLKNYILKHSVYDETTKTFDHAIIITGDFNTTLFFQGETNPWNDGLLSVLIEQGHLNDAWAVDTIDSIKEDALDEDGNRDYSAYHVYCTETTNVPDYWGHYDSVERVLYASGNGIKLSCADFGYGTLRNEAKESLSDHNYAKSSFTYEIVEKVQDTSYNHDSTDTEPSSNFFFMFLNYIASIFKTLGKILQDYFKWM